MTWSQRTVLARALFSEMFVSSPRRPVNNARFVFLDPRSTAFYRDWSKAADDTVAILRTQAGQDPHNKALSDLVGELSTQSEEFRTRWAAHNVRQHFTGTKRVRHPAVGDIELTYEVFDVSTDNDLRLIVYTTQPGSTSEDASEGARQLDRHPGTNRRGLIHTPISAYRDRGIAVVREREAAARKAAATLLLRGAVLDRSAHPPDRTTVFSDRDAFTWSRRITDGVKSPSNSARSTHFRLRRHLSSFNSVTRMLFRVPFQSGSGPTARLCGQSQCEHSNPLR